MKVVLLLFIYWGILLALVHAGALEHVIITPTGVASEMKVTFRTTTKPPNPMIQYGVGTALKSLTIPSSSVTHYKIATSKSAPDSYFVSATLTGLAAGKTYNYQITVDSKKSKVSWTKYSFRTPPAKGYPLRIALFGDLGSKSTSLSSSLTGSLTYFASKKKIDYVVHFGDLAYNLDSYSGRQGYLLMSALTPVAATIPYIVGPGNHEYARNSMSYYQALFAGQKTMGQRSGSPDPTLYFSQDIGNVHIVMINTEYVCTAENTDVEEVVAQYKWLDADLAKAHKSGKWIVVAGHRMMFDGWYQDYASTMLRAGIQCTDSSWKSCSLKPCSNPASSSCGYGMGKLFQKYYVDMIFQGHIHFYKRFYPQGDGIWEPQPDVKEYLNPQLPVSIISGAPGTAHASSFKKRADDGVESITQNFTRIGREVEAAPKTVTAFDDITTYSWTLLTVIDDNHLSVQQIQTSNGKILDSFKITHSGTKKVTVKTHAWTPYVDTSCNQ